MPTGCWTGKEGLASAVPITVLEVVANARVVIRAVMLADAGLRFSKARGISGYWGDRGGQTESCEGGKNQVLHDLSPSLSRARCPASMDRDMDLCLQNNNQGIAHIICPLIGEMALVCCLVKCIYDRHRYPVAGPLRILAQTVLLQL